MTTSSFAAPRTIRLGAREYPLVLPTWRDPRLHLAAVIFSLQILGQTALRFELSIAQILVSLATAALLEMAIVFWQRREIMWPASALLTGNGVAFILRVQGTHYGDWWSMRGAWIFALTAAVSVLSKYLIRVEGRHLFNPSNLGLVLCFLVLGTHRVNPLDFWWGPLSIGLVLALAVIVAGGLLIAWRLNLFGIVLSFWATFAVALGVLAAGGHAMAARWHLGPVTGAYFWAVLVTSPEVLLFLFFMTTDPKTAPEGRVARVVYGVAVGFLAVLLIAPQRTEFGSKVALLGALTIVCAFRPLLDRLFPAVDDTRDHLGVRLRRWFGWESPRRVGAVAGRVLTFVVVVVFGMGLVVAAGGHARTAAAQDVVAGAGVARPVVPASRTRIETVTVDPPGGKVASTMSPVAARRVAHDTVADLVILARARAERDAALVGAAASEHVRTTAEAEIRRAQGSHVPDEYTFRTVGVGLVGSGLQVPPTIHVRVDATVRPGGSGASQPFRRVYTVAWNGSAYVLLTDITPTG